MRLAGCYERAWYGRHSERSGKFDRGSGGRGGYIRRAADISAMADMADILVEIRKVWFTPGLFFLDFTTLKLLLLNFKII